MKIVIEGVNGSGKSTLAQTLGKELGLECIHAGPKPITDLMATLDCRRQLGLIEGILDRATCISRQIYGDANDDVNGLSYRHIDMMNNYLQLLIRQGCIFIHTTGQGKHIIKDYYTEEHVKNITKDREIFRERYFSIFKRIPHYDYDFDHCSIHNVVQWIKSKHRSDNDTICESTKRFDGPWKM